MKKLKTLLTALLLTLTLSTGYTTVVSTNPSDWTIYTGKAGIDPIVTVNDTFFNITWIRGYWLDWGEYGMFYVKPTVGYVFTYIHTPPPPCDPQGGCPPPPPVLSVPASITIRFKMTTSNATWLAADANETVPGRVRLFFSITSAYEDTHGPDFYNGVPFEFLRWWTNPQCYTLGTNDNQELVMTTSLDPSLWSSVYGKFGNHPDAQPYWNYIKSHILRVGFTFGGQSFFGHGLVLTGGDATFELLDYQIEDGINFN